MNRLFAAWILIAFLLPTLAMAQRVRAYVQDKLITTDEVMPLLIEVDGPALSKSPNFPDIWGMKKLGRNREQINGKTIYIQTYQPIRPGMFELPAIPVNLGNRTVNTLGITVRVDRGKLPIMEEMATTLSADRPVDAFITFELSKTDVLVGQQVRAEIKLWMPPAKRSRYRWNPQDLEALAGQLIQDKLWFERLLPLPEQPTEETKDGEKYLTFLFYKAFLFPQEAKTYTMGGGEIFIERLLTHARGNRPARYEQLSFALPILELTAEALPESNISKAESVGEYSMTYELGKTSFLTGETIPLKILVKGDGNIAMIPQPKFEEPEQFLMYDPSSNYQVTTSTDTLTGIKTFSYDLVPAFQGNYTLGPIDFYFFDPKATRYDSIRIDSIPILVKGENIPQLLEVDALDNFYRDAFERGDDQMPFRYPYPLYIILACGLVALTVLGRNVYRIIRHV